MRGNREWGLGNRAFSPPAPVRGVVASQPEMEVVFGELSRVGSLEKEYEFGEVNLSDYQDFSERRNLWYDLTDEKVFCFDSNQYCRRMVKRKDSNDRRNQSNANEFDKKFRKINSSESVSTSQFLSKLFQLVSSLFVSDGDSQPRSLGSLRLPLCSSLFPIRYSLVFFTILCYLTPVPSPLVPSPSSLNAQTNEGIRYPEIKNFINSNQFDAAQRRLTSELKNNKMDASLDLYQTEIWIGKANILYEKAKFKSAFNFYELAYAKWPSHPVVYKRYNEMRDQKLVDAQDVNPNVVSLGNIPILPEKKPSLETDTKLNNEEKKVSEEELHLDPALVWTVLTILILSLVATNVTLVIILLKFLEKEK
ncbi:MAG: hypothetical protein SFU98_11745 [Leptospiraceae bacterium]|nr:hypothetical protein [Leptospiraceae bacterium]